MATVPDLKALENQDKLYFQVLITYIEGRNAENPGVNTELETGALQSFDEADSIVRRAAEQFLTSVSDYSLVELNPDQQTDEFHVLVIDNINSVVVAKFGIIAIDYTKATMH